MKQRSTMVRQVPKEPRKHCVLVLNDDFTSFEFVVDIMMPKMDGFSVCKEIRKISMVPIIMVTARGEDFERIMGLDMGADDYVIKPFSPSEVMGEPASI